MRKYGCPFHIPGPILREQSRDLMARTIQSSPQNRMKLVWHHQARCRTGPEFIPRISIIKQFPNFCNLSVAKMHYQREIHIQLFVSLLCGQTIEIDGTFIAGSDVVELRCKGSICQLLKLSKESEDLRMSPIVTGNSASTANVSECILGNYLRKRRTIAFRECLKRASHNTNIRMLRHNIPLRYIATLCVVSSYLCTIAFPHDPHLPETITTSAANPTNGLEHSGQSKQ
jgi:hypothetical protein